MQAFDKIVATLSLIGLALFIGVVTVYVSEVDLWLITIAVICIACWFFWDELRAGGSHIEGDGRGGGGP